MFAAAAPALFVLIWSTGFIAARAVVPHADPQLFLVVRMGLVALLLAAMALPAKERWPRGRKLLLHLLAGTMLPGFYLVASWWAVQQGMPAGIMALLGALQPLIVAFLSFLIHRERLHGRGWLGLGVGVAGVAMVLMPALQHGSGALPPLAAAVAIVSILGMAGATMIQHAYLAADPIRSAGAVQNASGTLVALVAALLLGHWRWDNSATLWLGLGWSVLALSAAALSLLSWMLRHQGATRVSSLLLLVPALAAVEAWAFFGERLGPIQLAGFVLALGGVLLARSRSATPPSEPA
jgi:drug/metabolite transporter (DMT)-like permease